MECLISIRKAVFVEIEIDYCIHKWADADPSERMGLLAYSRGGIGANSWKRNKDWIRDNVQSPFDYIQVDPEKLRIDAMEWGISTSELENLRRLTPDVFRSDKDAQWHVQYDLQFPPNEGNAENARYCLDRAISVLLRKQQHTNARRWPGRNVGFEPPPVYLGASVYKMARQDSDVAHKIDDSYRYQIISLVSGFDPSEHYYTISGHKPVDGSMFGKDWINGFLLVQDDA